MPGEIQSSPATKALYRPVGRISSLLAGEVAGALFQGVWRRTRYRDHDEVPTALQSETGLGEIVLASVLQGAINGGVRALINRGGARAFERWTGMWPGD
jgi:Protein of unknown function (DUF4235)